MDQNPRRHKAGPHASRPLIGDAMLRIYSCCRSLVDAHPDRFSIPDLLGVVRERLQARPDRPIRQLTLQSLAWAAERYLPENERGADLEAALGRAWDAPERALAPVDPVVDRLVGLGVDGERLAWDVITHESNRHYPLVLREASRMAEAWPGHTAEDLIGYAWSGLRLALRSYDPRRGLFSTYACPRIRGSIRDGIRSEHHLPKRLLTWVRKVESTQDSLTEALGRHPSAEEVAAELGVDADRVRRLPLYQAPASLDSGPDRALSDIPDRDAPDMDDVVYEALRSEAISDALARLDSVSADIVVGVVVNSEPVASVARRHGLTVRQARGRLAEALGALRSSLDGWD